MPPRYMGALVAGQALGGLLLNLIRAAAIKIWPVRDPDIDNNSLKGALFVFLFGAVIMTLCSLIQLYLRSNRFSKHYLKPYSGYK